MNISEIRGKISVVGLAETGCGVTPGWSAMELMATAVYDALEDSGINIKEVDGLFAATAFHSMAAMSLSEYLGIRPKFADGSNEKFDHVIICTHAPQAEKILSNKTNLD